MRIPVKTDHESIMLAFTLQGANAELASIRFRVADAYKPGCVYIDRIGTLGSDEKTFYLQLPSTGKLTIVDITTNGIHPLTVDGSFKLIKKEVLDLPVFPELYNEASELMQSGIKFLQGISQNLGIYSSDSSYGSDCGRFRVDVMDQILDLSKVYTDEKGAEYPNPNYGQPLVTPCRISIDRGYIQLNKPIMMGYTVYERDVTLFHEEAHFFINDDQHSEEESDMHSMLISIGKGYGYVDIDSGFGKVFKGTPTPQNINRHQLIRDFLINKKTVLNLKTWS